MRSQLFNYYLLTEVLSTNPLPNNSLSILKTDNCTFVSTRVVKNKVNCNNQFHAKNAKIKNAKIRQEFKTLLLRLCAISFANFARNSDTLIFIRHK